MLGAADDFHRLRHPQRPLPATVAGDHQAFDHHRGTADHRRGEPQGGSARLGRGLAHRAAGGHRLRRLLYLPLKAAEAEAAEAPQVASRSTFGSF